jgi:hypothetical protein
MHVAPHDDYIAPIRCPAVKGLPAEMVIMLHQSLCSLCSCAEVFR